MSLEKLCSGASWSEGPVWVESEQCVLWSDIPNNRILCWSETQGLNVWREKVEFTNGHFLDLNGDLLHCSHGLRAIVRTPLVNGVLRADAIDQIVVDQYGGQRLNSPNDLVVKRDGTIWFTDPPYGILSNHEGYEAQAEQAGHYVYCWSPATQVLTAMTQVTPISVLEDPNGLAFSPDESILYVSDTSSARYANDSMGRGHHHIVAFDVIKQNNALSISTQIAPTCVDTAHYILTKPRIFAVVEPGLPDGFRVDELGRIYTSSLDSVQIYAPSGRLLGKLRVPEKVGNLCFGGDSGQDLYIAASTSLYRFKNAKNLFSGPSA
jgi:gluconolactonase